MSAAITILEVLTVWFLFSLVCGLLVGRFLKRVSA